MEHSLFTALSTYKPTDGVNPEENYSTELLAQLLRFSLKKGSYLFTQFADKLLGEFVNVSDYQDIRIDTQELFYTSTNNKALNNKAFPDITIRIKDRCLFIEVKVESGLNYYEADNGDYGKEIINQVSKYQGIQVKPKNIYLLTKYHCEFDPGNCEDFKGKFRWHDVHRLLKEYSPDDPVEEYLVQETITYLEDKGMSIPKVTFEFVRGMEMLNNLFKQIETALEGYKIEKSFGYNWMGYYIYILKKTGERAGVGWVGNAYESDKLLFEHQSSNVSEHIKSNNLTGYETSNKYKAKTYFNFEERKYFCLPPDEQVDALKQWIDENCDLIEKYGQ